MGKIRVKTLGDEEAEKKQKEELKRKKEAKQAEKIVEEKVEAPKEEETVTKEEEKSVKAKNETKALRSKKYQSLAENIEEEKIYSLSDALETLSKLQRGKFDETVELHINTVTTGITGNVVLPHGTGKKTRVAVASDSLISEIEKGVINFDILVSEPSMMPKLARVARVLGPRGLMPNPKNGTISQNPQELVKKYEGGQLNFKTEAKFPILHLSVGKMSFGKDKLTENINTMIVAVKKSNIRDITLKSTMSPGIKVKV